VAAFLIIRGIYPELLKAQALSGTVFVKKNYELLQKRPKLVPPARARRDFSGLKASAKTCI
jgi:hypothetical protein